MGQEGGKFRARRPSPLLGCLRPFYAVENGREAACLASRTDRSHVVGREAFLEIIDAVLPFHSLRIHGQAICNQDVGICVVDGDPRF